MWRNTSTRYGRISRALHWLLALAIVGLFGLGWWMTGLSYYDRWYHDALQLHRALGSVTAMLIVIRVIWSLLDARPAPVASQKRWEVLAARATHLALYAVMIALPVTGYLISTAKGSPVDVFGLFEIPALLEPDNARADWSGAIHGWIAYGGAILVLLHVAAALKHQLLDRDGTLRRMIG